jgi:predicted ATPase
MPARRDRRRFGPGPYLLGLRRVERHWARASLHGQSHGESFLALAGNRFGGDSLYVLDEPEAALSASGALALVAIVARAARAGAQFVIATHSPILLAIPGARIYELTRDGLAPCAYDDLDAVRLIRGFLEAPERTCARRSRRATDEFRSAGSF